MSKRWRWVCPARRGMLAFVVLVCVCSGGSEEKKKGEAPFDFRRVQALVHKAGLASSSKDYPASVALYREASALMGSAVNVKMQERLGDALMHTADYEAAFQAYTQAFSIPPRRSGSTVEEHSAVGVKVAAAASASGRHAHAAHALTQVVSSGTDAGVSPLLFFSLAEAMERAGKEGGREGEREAERARQVARRLIADRARERASKDTWGERAAAQEQEEQEEQEKQEEEKEGEGGKGCECDEELVSSYVNESARSIGELLEGYARWHQAALCCCSSLSGQQHGRILVYRPSGEGEGWGNRVLALSSAMFTAIASRRIFLLHWTSPGHVSELLSPPRGLQWSLEDAPRQCTLPPDAFDEGVGSSAAARGEGWAALRVETLYQDPQLLTAGPPAILYSSLHDLFRPVRALPLFAHLRRLCALNRRSLSPEDAEGARLSKWELFACTGEWLFNPSGSVQRQMRRVRQSWRAQGADLVVAVAVRRGSKATSHYSVIHQGGEDKLLACTHLLLQGYGGRGRVVVASDSGEARARFLHAFPGRALWTNTSIGYSGSGPKQQLFGQHARAEQTDIPQSPLNAVQDAAVEWFVVGEADDALLSAGSTFGQTGWGRRLRRMPLEVDNHHSDCLRRLEEEDLEVLDPLCCSRHAAQPDYQGRCPPTCRLSS